MTKDIVHMHDRHSQRSYCGRKTYSLMILLEREYLLSRGQIKLVKTQRWCEKCAQTPEFGMLLLEIT